MSDLYKLSEDWLQDAAENPSKLTEFGVETVCREALQLRKDNKLHLERIDTLRRELAERTRERDRASLDYAELTKDCTKAEAERDAANEERDRWIAAHGIAIRDRNEFAAAQVVKFVNDWNASDDDDLPLVAFAARRAAELRKAAPVAAPADIIDSMHSAKPGPCENWGPLPAEPWLNQPLTAEEKDATDLAGRKLERWDEAFKSATPPADLRQAPADADGRYRETLNRAFDAMQARMDANAAKLAEWPALVARLAAAEKARAELLNELRGYVGIGKALIEAADRAGGAS